MKRSCLIIVLLLAVATSGWANLLTNPGFESLGTGWSFSNEVSVQNWAWHTGTNGVSFHGWNVGTGDNRVFQDVVATNGTYTFTIWVRREANNGMTNLAVQIDWLNAGGAILQTVSNTYNSLPNNRLWHQLAVSGTCPDVNAAKVRATLFCQWAPGGVDPRALMVDDANLYAGAYAGSSILNGSFEIGAYNNWDISYWIGTLAGMTNGGSLASDSWAARSGTNAIAIYSWDGTSNNYTTTFSQYVYPASTGSYVFTIYIKREANALFSNAVMSIAWYDKTLTNAVQSTTVSNLNVPNDGNWIEYHVEGVAASPAVYEARCSVSCDWSFNGVQPDPRSVMVDDARFLPGTYAAVSDAMNTDWCYHNGVGYNARYEQVPGTSVGSFLQVNPLTTTVTFYVLGASPSQAKLYPLEDNRWEIRTSWLPPTNSATWVTTYSNMTRLGDVVIPAGTPFHGLPSVGSQTMSLWKCVWPFPTAPSGLAYTNHLQVFYSPFTKTTNGVQETSYKYLGRLSAAVTNNLGQHLVVDPINHDYVFDVNPIKWAVFTNGSFEQPVPFASTFDDSGWSGFGDAGRETWGGRTGSVGAVFRTWNAGAFEIYQDIATTGGAYRFSGWLQPQTGAAPIAVAIAMEWYDKSGSLVQENKQELMPGLYEEFDWQHLGVVGGCDATNLDYVRVLVSGQYNVGAESSATMLDDMEFVNVSTNLLNGGFEIGPEGRSDIRDWFGVLPYFAGYSVPPRIVEIHTWAKLTGSNGLAFHGWEEAAPRYEAQIDQPVAASTGTYVYSVWVKREVNFVNLTNAELRLEWYGGAYPTKLQADTVVKITPPNDNTWYQYAVTGTCNNTGLRFVQPVLLVQWNTNPTADQRSFMIDDVALVYTNLAGGGTTDGIPDSWWDFYSIPLGNRQATNDYDNDGFSNLEEYTGDTIPSNINSFFSRATNSVSGNRAVMYLIVNPSSLARNYDAWWKTNLMESSAWQRTGQSVPGNGGLIQIGVTNDLGKRYYRTGAIVP